MTEPCHICHSELCNYGDCESDYYAGLANAEEAKNNSLTA